MQPLSPFDDDFDDVPFSEDDLLSVTPENPTLATKVCDAIYNLFHTDVTKTEDAFLSSFFNGAQSFHNNRVEINLDKTRIQSLAAALLAIPLFPLNLIIKITRLAIHLLQLLTYDIYSLIANKSDRYIYTFKAGQIAGDLFGITMDIGRFFYVFAKHLACAIKPTLANIQEPDRFTYIFELPDNTPPDDNDTNWL